VKVPEESGCPWRVDGGDRGQVFVTARFLKDKSMSLHYLLLDTRPAVLLAVSFWCFSRFSRSCGLSVVGAWSSRA
jgi:hypothetical protein